MSEAPARRQVIIARPKVEPEADDAEVDPDDSALGYDTVEINEELRQFAAASDGNLRGVSLYDHARLCIQRNPEALITPTILGERDLYPIDAPGMPLPGKDMQALAAALGSEFTLPSKHGRQRALFASDGIMEMLYRDLLYSSGDFHMPLSCKGGLSKQLAVVSGHVWNDDAPCGPARADIMVIGKMLGMEEKNRGRNLVGPTGDLLREACDTLGIEGYEQWYVTNLLKTEHPEAINGETTLRSGWINEFLPLLHQELRIVQPQYILCLGADAAKAVLGKRATVKGMTGRVIEFTYPIARDYEGVILTHTALVMVCTHPAAVLHAPEQQDAFESGLARWGQLCRGMRPDREEEGLDHREIDSVEQLRDLYEEIDRTCERNLIAIDAEWNEAHPQNAGAYIRTIQLSWKFKSACCIHVTHAGGEWRFKGTKEQLAYWIKKICKKRRLAGHFFSADLEHLVDAGIDLRDEFDVADTWVETMTNAVRMRSGGFDTALALHAFDETADFGLKPASLRFTSAPPYDTELLKWRDEYCSSRGLKKEDMDGHGQCPDNVLVPYGNYDVDVTWRMAVQFVDHLTSDRFGNNCWEAFWMSMRAQPAVLEITRNGILVDRERADRMTETYMAAKSELEQKIIAWSRWPELNLQSVFHVRELLFGEEFNGKNQDNPAAPPIRLRPPGARSLRLTPTMTTDKRPMAWEEVVHKGLETVKSPSTNKISLAILAQENQATERFHPVKGKMVKYDFSEQVTWIRDYRFISQVLKSILRIPKKDEETDEFIKKDGYYVYPGGLLYAVCDDGRVRTTVYQTKETGRWSSSRPPLQNLGKQRETDYKRILGPLYRWPLRTILRAPEGSLLIEADFIGAELYGMAIMSGDQNMIEQATRNILPEWHPDYYDIHSNIAKLAFRLECEPTKGGLNSIGKSSLRVVAKSVVFGVAYGRGAKAIALAVKEQGVYVTVEDAQQVIDALFEMYPDLVPFFDGCRARAVNERWLCGPFGRYRRFPIARDRKMAGDFERQAQNVTIQGMVADAASLAGAYLYRYRRSHPEVQYKLSLQNHDAWILEVPYSSVVQVVDEVLPNCMSKWIPIYPTNLDGTSNGTGPYHLGIDVAPYVFWGEHMMPNDCLIRELPPRIAGWREHEDGWIHPEYVDKATKRNKIWRGDASGGKLEVLAA